MESIILKLSNVATVHSPYLIGSTIVWTLIYVLCKPISRYFKPLRTTYDSLPHALQLQWDTRIVALIHALIITGLATYGFFFDDYLISNKIYGKNLTGYTVMIIACGYFAWDLFICIKYFKEFQLGFLLHAIGCFLTYFFSLDGLLIYYGHFYLLYEASTPFLNFHWFMDKLGVSNANLFKKLNGFLLIASFFFVRIIFGCTYSVVVWRDIRIMYANAVANNDWAVIGICYYFNFAILLLNGLNVFWFYSIIKFATKPPKAVSKKKEQGQAKEVKKD
jgi:hypothetical protein